LELAAQPEPGEVPLALDRGMRNLQDHRRLGDGKSRQVPQLNNLCVSRLDLGEMGKRFIEDQEVKASWLLGCVGVVE
jgi:hypothetical protein